MNTQKQSLIHQIDEEVKGLSIPLFIGIIFGVILLGTGIGFAASRLMMIKNTSLPNTVKSNKTAGIVDKKTFKDKVEGKLKEGGIDGEGNFHLERPGGISQNVYLTSSTVDLMQYIGKKIRVHGETFKGQKAGWLMDVGLVEVL
ncbi:hypothetical protein A2334_04070 [Candidatus Roizmanbacteria bacterium RIFOXYB2_FULL_38_10]|uniref:Uncharacterized protein n=1 Tax=Candidatus Roizmanbacteria bacterium RIFOXYD1_FULL_38_12 TaxID=1802093 RepID=A0A1F7KZG7_9BACT|nr:MAG: hypothetical protein A3K47_00180 [Candidatus Roizmanbacteria bacterium RIFOXYA2_FULL_38_14]OGK63218.1 MAG: hypothetical protein A3K27_00180 [Candidatus Roizmanbacteria bacterium RIFOXYA1_FULL_37_12]OGK65064.1 MAG: hypothetical protein A3K38_00180 [Candidatus Roizmanbacteria bacterium RIFOXYB1_FULL_40_23]OGK68619.1 MAG: hypothetical protein A2334_04070 [Candidatus Roizmanbacteria bacterium RIFOXYB2_FULL_38_10]OGK69468.1 MAG: hypothetical protein A3K21_00180 [Candidatus Roizmanbacteria ba